ncbi:glycosyltransferase [Psychrobacter sp. I-STPA10]|uniref:glycosyltransferase n=1 Tax=Psychrobacter sp. I-STPA10 TaxID=2585769 RepID=UPI001E5B0500|nr:glycosyltransferase [Psychrobacter sp. I-STPA10]
MNVLFINGVFPVLSQTFVLDHIKGFKESGAKVQVLARKKTNFQFESAVPEIEEKLLYIKPVNKKLILRCIKGFIKRPRKSLMLIALRLNKKIHLQTLITYLQLESEPDVMITHFGNNYPISTQLKKYVLKSAKNIIIFHGHDITSYIYKNGWKKYRQVDAYIDYAICVNKKFAETLRKNTNIKNIECIYLGTNLPIQTRLSHYQDIPQLLFVGRMVEKKGLIYLILACKILKDKGVKFRLHIVGDGPLKKDIENEIRAIGLLDQVVIYGAQQHSFIIDLMNKCDIFVLPSIVASNMDSEGLPVVLMEAMNAGMIVVSTYHSGIPELVTNNINGFLVKEGDFIELANTIKKAFNLDDSSKYEIIKNAKDKVQNQHNKNIQVQKLISLVGKV